MSGQPVVPVRRWAPWMLTLAAIWGCSFLFIEVGIRQLHPTYVTMARVCLGALTLLVVLAVRRIGLPRGPRVWAHLAVLGLVGAVLPFTLFGYGEQRIPSLLAGIWNSTTPLVTLPLAVLVFRTEVFTRNRVVGMVVGFAGTLVVLGVWQGVPASEIAGQLMCFAAAALYAVAIPYQRRFVTPVVGSDLAVAAGMLLCATAELAVLAPLVAGAPPAPTSLSSAVLLSMLALGALGTGVAFVIHLRNIRWVGGTTASFVTYLVPIFAILVGVLVLDEELRWNQPVGAAVVLLGVAIAQRPARSSARSSAQRSPTAHGSTQSPLHR